MAPAIDLTSFFGTNPGLHTVDITVERDTCLASDSRIVDVTPALLAVDVIPPGPISIAENGAGPTATVTATGGGATTFQWAYSATSGGPYSPFAGETNSSYLVEGADFPGPGTYFLVATASPACGVSMVSNEVTVDVTLSTPEPLVAITALSTNGQNFLEWATPATPCTALHILRRDDGTFPTSPGDPLADWVSGADFPCAPTTKGSHPDTGLSNDTKYSYAAWVMNGANISLPSTVKGRPFDHTVGKVKWALHTQTTAMTQPGIQIRAGASAIYLPTNSGLILALQGGPSGGMWLPGAMPVLLGLPSQSRPPVVPFAVGISPNDAPDGAAFVTSQDGNVYALDAEDLGPVWTATVGQSLQGAAAGIFAGFGATKNWVLTGTRNTTPPNGFRAIHAEDGNLEWFFENTSAQNGDDSRVGMVLAGASVDYPGQRVFFGSWKDANGIYTLWALDISSTDTPFLIWAKDVGDVETNPVYLASQQKLVVGSKPGQVRLLNANDGTLLWTHTTGDGNVKGFVSPHLHGATTNFMFSTVNNVTSIRDNGGSASVNWQITGIPSPSVPLFIPSTTTAIVGSGNGRLYRIDGVHTGSPSISNFVVLGDGFAGVGPSAYDVLYDMAIAGSEEGVIYGVEFPFP
jgi:outer membrane protein assembly factor BamB